MSHFASGQWNNPSGLVYQVVAKVSANLAASGTGAGTEGTDLWTFVVPRAGLYRMTAILTSKTASTAATSHTRVPVVAYTNDVGAVSGANMGGGTAFDAKSLAGLSKTFTQTLKAAAGSSIITTIQDAVVGTGTGDMYFELLIEAL